MGRWRESGSAESWGTYSAVRDAVTPMSLSVILHATRVSRMERRCGRKGLGGKNVGIRGGGVGIDWRKEGEM